MDRHVSSNVNGEQAVAEANNNEADTDHSGGMDDAEGRRPFSVTAIDLVHKIKDVRPQKG